MTDTLKSTPAWRRIAAILTDRISHDEWVPHQQIPSEAHLRDEFEVSRETIRRAIASLRTAGLVFTVARRGTYVAGPAVAQAGGSADPEEVAE